MEQDMRSSILQMAKGAIQERVDYEVSRVVDNILDMNTEPTVKRKVVLTIEMKPDENRQVITMNATAKSSLAPTTPIGTSLVITSDGNGEWWLRKSCPRCPGRCIWTAPNRKNPSC